MQRTRQSRYPNEERRNMGGEIKKKEDGIAGWYGRTVTHN